ncbi:protein-tyrosine-phosphatase [Salinarchaeum sp. Harcht-Bsk1]|uniref:low molecular weight phosphatase family protein n=1 Tax=Salinarchaeum sp. Harcht-Bsk1 TaxID=1333523 RepID=UPI0003424212|nr:low molecular weight phosphatase family protein [Salinarchaeum sp. Harcht-Bsk1]AGN01093.1 protein-tyrosine-phosphatase [Salinarchaeum sp. Harcht-Bsk1]
MTPDTDADDPIRIAFVCVQNAGRSQMSTAFAEHERERRGLEDAVEILTGGTHPADRVHDEVVDAMADAGFDVADRTPREITSEELRSCDHVATMGCSTLDVGKVDDTVNVRDWALEDPDGKDPERVREIRDEVEERVSEMFDEISRDSGPNREN